MLEHRLPFTEPPTADRFLRCPDSACRKVGFSADDSRCTCGTPLVHATLSEITSQILLRKNAKVEVLRNRRAADEFPGFRSFSDWALRFGVDSAIFRTYAAALMRDSAFEKHIVALDSSQKRFICDVEFSTRVIYDIAHSPHRQRRTAKRLIAALSAFSSESAEVHGSAN